MKNQPNFPIRYLANWKELASVYLASLLLFLPFFFFFFRLTAFATVPLDDYENFILKWDGKAPDFQFYSPQGYRWFYLGVGYVFYKLLPIIELSNLSAAQVAPMRAFQALAMSSFLFAHLFFYVNYCLVRIRLKKSVSFSLGVAFIIFFLGLSTDIYSVDAVTFAWTSLAIFWIGNLRWFAGLVLLSVFVNEKIPLLFAAYFSLIAVFDRRQTGWQPRLGIALLAVSFYFAERWLLGFPGYEYQTQPGQFFNRVGLSLAYLMSLKGLYMNIFPFLLLIGISAVCWKVQLFATNFYQSKAIAGVPILLFGLGVFACSNYGIGRICLHSLPFFAVPVGLLLEKLDTRSQSAQT